jgi:hypothetical protein
VGLGVCSARRSAIRSFTVRVGLAGMDGLAREVWFVWSRFGVNRFLGIVGLGGEGGLESHQDYMMRGGVRVR